jgi:hypothetical protein
MAADDSLVALANETLAGHAADRENEVGKPDRRLGERSL